MKQLHKETKYRNYLKHIQSDCTQCSGLCCTALFFSKIDGFPMNKEEGIPCLFLKNNFQCDMYEKLEAKGCHGCKSYDCFGAGQMVTNSLYRGKTWITHPELKIEMFAVFQIMYRLHEMLGYLLEASMLVEDKQIDQLLIKYEQWMKLTPKEILHIAIDEYQLQVNDILKNVCRFLDCYDDHNKQRNYIQKDMRKHPTKDLSMSLLLGANFSNMNAHGINFLGADLRGANFINTDLRDALFLTQRQVNGIIGNHQTLLPDHLHKPTTWD